MPSMWDQRIHIEELDSTNDHLKSLVANGDVSEGFWLTAGFQRAGRGQRSKRWFGEAGLNFYGSVLLKPQFLKVEEQFQLNLAISLALWEVVNDFVQEEPIIKWPNDILIDSKKISGILIENTINSEQLDTSIVGVGINVNQMSFPEEKVTSLAFESKPNLNLERLFLTLNFHIRKYYDRLKEGQDLKQEYLAKLFGYRDTVQIQHEEELLSGQIRDLDEFGCILFEKEGKLRRFCSGQITFLR